MDYARLNSGVSLSQVKVGSSLVIGDACYGRIHSRGGFIFSPRVVIHGNGNLAATGDISNIDDAFQNA